MIFPPGHLLGQIQRLQQEAARLRAEVVHKTVTIDVGAGAVRITVGGDLRVRHIVIAPHALEDPQMLEDLLVTGINKALEAAQEMVEQTLKPLEHLFPAGVDHLARL
ncbi:MAG: YbaB/EbfC family nucleoid-associated protein [Candidatus Kapabacteria bacterium]|nr:YbaB/EbfC family nucleoid-associated protein [Candidatus Kapabacteria bacterium]MDW7996709.1 YbaB/EbfC family nucleoid-associated protein [Bacteroidota bacterium]MDW8225329.1 YbaB/EbfC family nucleoid-associated protein [Bacteroidota bacterium]